MPSGRARRKNGSLRASKAAQRRSNMSHLIPESAPAVRPKTVTLCDDSPDTSDAASNTSATTVTTNPSSLPATSPTNGVDSVKKAMARKASSPMAPPFMVSAPGKVIVFGEHAVVHGKAAMAAAISLRSYFLVTTLSKSQRTITLNYLDMDFKHTWNIDDLPWDLFKQPSKKKYYYDLVTTLDMELFDSLLPCVKNVSPDAPEELRSKHERSALAFLYLFCSLGSPQNPGAIYTLRSTIPMAAGLGSSASVCTCLSAAMLLQIRTLAGPHDDQPPDEAELQIERINRWAFVGELCIHGNPSGVDNTVSTGGKAVIFKREDYSKPPTVTPLPNFPELPLLLVDTRQSRSTAVEVAKVGKLRKEHPLVTKSILDAIDKVTVSAQEAIAHADGQTIDKETLEHLGTLVRINHGFLVSLGVSHPRLERIRELVDFADIGWTKLTGAGGGGCAITLLRPDASEDALRKLETNLADENFQKYETTLGGDGVGVLWPAVLRNGSDEEGGEEIDLQKFENADGPEGIERLVGVGGPEKREGWKFWKRAV
ncbi:mevalonate kinase [Aspergillus heteromorphus CBS 117.55]|uniref:Mevalonate kinase n=1 Tax=Aspergillus heteromorphus CBS 117.55 TaxID=1448321 RepID=A0A317WIJ0_9EURO|nr:mevalonate kinase [Aspergillus heteromorphus CBS 117.55]PWY86119.1 mevalonate kinase [Aspergillus heteromorphus CBS 117.55]